MMNSKQRKTLSAIFAAPTTPDILWEDIEDLLQALGADVSYGDGPRIRCALNGAVAVIHRPHPERITGKGTVEAVQKFLKSAGVK
jgi:hypothetical protein